MINPDHNHPIFISHSSRDRETADRLVKDLERRGIPCWISSRDIGLGEDYQGAIVTALEAAPAMLLLFSTNANNSREIPRELSLASARRKPMIPVRLEDIVPSGALEYQLTNAQFIDLFQNYNEAIERLCAALRRQIRAAAEGDVPVEVEATAVRLPRRMSGSRIGLMGGGAAVIVAAAAGAFMWQQKSGTQAPLPPHPAAIEAESAAAKMEPPAPRSAPAVTPAVPEPDAQKLAATVHSTVESARPPALPAPPAAPAPRTPEPAPTHPVATPAQIVPPEVSMALPEPTPMPKDPALPSLPEAAKGSAGSGPLVRIVAQLSAINPSARENVLGQAFDMHEEKLSGEQAIALLEGITGGSRYNKLHDLIDHMQTPLNVPQALGILNASGDSRVGMIQQLAPLLPTTLSGPDLVALLGRTTGGDRYNGLNALAHNVSDPIDTASALAILRPSGNSWVGMLQLMVPLLPRPMQATDVQLLLGRLDGGDRYNAVNALLSNMPDTVSVENALAFLRGSGNSYVGVLQLLAPHLPDGLSVPQLTALLGRTTGGDRYNALNTITGHVQNNVKGAELDGVLHLLSNSWVGGLQLIAGHLAVPQDGPSLAVLMGTVSGGDRYNALIALAPVLPDHLSFDEAAMILHGMGSAQVGAIQIIARHCDHLTDDQRAALLTGLSSGERANALRAFSQAD
ncbi:TIR domain-containing protein [Acetobacter sp. LMG 32666]|uniref:toll/interleukin-1 receptor domain-containing protein n=1 Tax=Acetobacter sp. LMG 32666 TaxID=2959295 RepID=UPI0030C8484F